MPLFVDRNGRGKPRSHGLSHPDFDAPALPHVALLVPSREPPIGADQLGARQRQNAEIPQAGLRGQDLDDRQCAREAEARIVGRLQHADSVRSQRHRTELAIEVRHAAVDGPLVGVPDHLDDVDLKRRTDVDELVGHGGPQDSFEIRSQLGAALPISGPAWQVMPSSRNRNWGHPTLIRFLENLALEVRKAGIWNGLLIGDISQLHGGPMSTGHASHQIGLDADIWLTPMPKEEPVRAEREEMMSTNVVGRDRLDVDPTKWMPRHGALIKAAALNAQVERIFVNPAIKKALCRETTGNRTWLHKVRPWWGHDYHFHVRLRCPADSAECTPQDPPPPGDGCDKDLDWWFTDEGLYPKPGPEKPLAAADLPPACRSMLAQP